MKLKITIFLSLFCCSYFSNASYFCVGKVSNVIINTNGYVGVRADKIYGDANARFVCNLDQEWNNVSIETCKVLAAKLLTKEASKEDVKIQYTDELTCITQPANTNSNRIYSVH